jgi:hypothetical protein
MPVRKKSFWDRYPTITLMSDIDTWSRKHKLFRGDNLKLALTTGIRNKSEYNIIKKILHERGK